MRIFTIALIAAVAAASVVDRRRSLQYDDVENRIESGGHGAKGPTSAMKGPSSSSKGPSSTTASTFHSSGSGSHSKSHHVPKCGLPGLPCCHTIKDNLKQPPCLHGLGCDYNAMDDPEDEIGICTPDCGGYQQPCCNSVTSTHGDSTCECGPNLYYSIAENMCKPCGTYGQLPCPSDGCSGDLVPDGTNWYWYYTANDGAPLSNGPTRRRSLGDDADKSRNLYMMGFYEEVCVPCGGEYEIPCPTSDKCDQGFSPQYEPNYEQTLCLPCGARGTPPCPDGGCAAGLTTDGFGWRYLTESDLAMEILFAGLEEGVGRRLRETTSTFNEEQTSRRLGILDPEGKYDYNPPALCVPCGELAQIPCAPCEGNCTTSCSQGLTSTNIVGYFDENVIDIPISNTTTPDGEVEEFLTLIIGLHICLPCGAEGQPPCDDTGCLRGLAQNEEDGRCAECGELGQIACPETGCIGVGITPNANGLCTPCGSDGQLPCSETGCLPGLTEDPSISDASQVATCIECGELNQIACPETGCIGVGITPNANGLCTPCGSDGQLPCSETGCLPGLTEDPSISDASQVATCIECGELNQIACPETGCIGVGITPNANGLCTPCGSDGQLPCSETGCLPGLTEDPSISDASQVATCIECGELNQIACPETGCIGVGVTAISDGTCAECGELGQIACPDTGCIGVGVTATSDGTCAECGKLGQIACPETGCIGVGVTATSDGTCTECGELGQIACPDTGCIGVGVTATSDGTCTECGELNQMACPETGCVGVGVAPNTNGLCAPCGAKDQPPCPDVGCFSGLTANAIESTSAVATCIECGAIGQPPCDTDCISGLTPDGNGWINLVEYFTLILGGPIPDRRLSEVPKSLRSLRDIIEHNRRHLGVPFPGFPDFGEIRMNNDYGLCVPCGEFGQIPCAPCEGTCAGSCSSGLIATNLAGYLAPFTLFFEDFGFGDLPPCGDDFLEFPCPPGCGGEAQPPCSIVDILGEDFISEILRILVGLHVCLPCGAEGQPPCADGCGNGFVVDFNPNAGDFGPLLLTGICIPCGADDQPPCEDGCATGFATAVVNAGLTDISLCKPCGNSSQPCCCDSSEYDLLYETFGDSPTAAPLYLAAIENANADPNKCISGCLDTRCKPDGFCDQVVLVPAPAPV